MADADGGAARFDLAGNPLPPLPGSVQPPTSGEAGVWPPAPTGADPSQMSVPNDSGEKAGYPPEVAAFKWNWSPWFLTWIWCFGMKMPAWGAAYLGLIVLSRIPMVGVAAGPLTLALTIYLCLNGHKLAWQNRRFAGGFPEYLAVQRAWFKWGLGIFVVSVLLLPAILLPVFMKARMNARMRSGYYSQPNGSGGSFGAPARRRPVKGREETHSCRKLISLPHNAYRRA